MRLLRAADVGQLRSLVGGSRHVDLGVVSDSSMRCTVVSVCTCIMPTQYADRMQTGLKSIWNLNLKVPGTLSKS